MSNTISKRQQARNEKQLQELVQTVPGNNFCADCHNRNPAWASWSLGVFLCLRCAAIHRKLGTHISKVKSLSMDSWSNEQVDNMRKVGNVVSNQIYNPENKRAPVPIDADEADSAMERFIRQKYIHNVATYASKPGSPRSDEGIPPPLPPKNTSSKFSFRAGSLFPLNSKKKEAKVQAIVAAANHQPNLANKQSKVFGASVDYGAADDTDKKLQKLRDMGFPDNQKNALILKGVNGNVDRAVEALIRLGEGGEKPLPTPGVPHKLRQSRSMTPLTPNLPSSASVLSMPKRAESDRPTTSSTTFSTNPFDTMRAQPQTAQSTGSLPANNPYNMASSNPFASMTQQGNVEQAFQGLSMSASPPQRSASFPLSQPFHQQSAPTSPQAQQDLSFAPTPSMTFPMYAQQQPIQQAPLQPQPTGYNPFFSQQPNTMPSNPQAPFAVNQTSQSPAPASNPYGRGPTRMASSPALGQIPEQTQIPQMPAPFMSTSPMPLASPSTNPFFTNTAQPVQNGGQYPFMQQPQQLQQAQYSQPLRHDKASIMALYNQPGAFNQKPAGFETSLQIQSSVIPEDQPVNATAPPSNFAAGLPSRSASQPLPGSNPYMSNGAVSPTAPMAANNPFGAPRHISRESMKLGMDMAWQNGRHSPDAFASLSSNHA